MSESEDRIVTIPSDVSSPRVLTAKDPLLPNNKMPGNMIPALYSFEEWFEAVVLSAPRWLDGETPAITAATIETQMALSDKFEGKKPGDRVVVTKEEHAMCVPIMKEKDRMIAGPLGPKTHKFIYAWMSAPLASKEKKLVAMAHEKTNGKKMLEAKTE